MNTAKVIYDEEPKAIEVVRYGASAVAFYVRENIEQVEVPAGAEGEEGATETRTAWQADEHVATGLSIRDAGDLVSAIVRAKYSLDEELAIQRQRETKPDEFADYFAFCEAAKAAAKA